MYNCCSPWLGTVAGFEWLCRYLTTTDLHWC